MREINRWLGKKSATHLLLDGGVLSVKEEEYEAFKRAYLNDIAKGEKLCVVEKKTTPCFRFFVDIDYTGDFSLDFEKIVKELYRIVRLGPCVVSKAEPRVTPKGTKYGVHVVWYESVVDKKTANSIRLKILDELGHEDWEKIIDASVYSGSGLRMIWSYKNEDGSTPYVPWFEITEMEQVVKLSPGREKLLDMFSIRIPSSLNSGLVAAVADSSTGQYAELEQYIQKNIPGQECARISRVSKCKNKKDYWISTSSKYCHNVKREHKSNHVWFLLRPGSRTIAQKCQDDECKEYTGRFYKIPSSCVIPNERVLDTRPHCTIYDYLPDGWKQSSSRHERTP